MSRRPNVSTAVCTSLLGGLGRADRGDDGDSGAPGIGDRLHGRVGGGGVDVVDDDRGALSCEFLRVGQAQAAARTGDDGDFAFE